MSDTPIAHFPQTRLSQPIFLRAEAQNNAGVMQDKSAAGGERIASGQPEHSVHPVRADAVSTKSSRSQKQHAHAPGFVSLTIHVPCIVRDEIERRAERNAIVKNGKRKSLSLSEIGRPIFTKGLQADIDMQYGALLEPIVRKTIQNEMRSLRKFVALCFARIGFDTGQTRAIATNILGRQPGMTQEVCTKILDKSAESAKKNLIRQTPQIANLLEVFDQWMLKSDAENTVHGE